MLIIITFHFCYLGIFYVPSEGRPMLVTLPAASLSWQMIFSQLVGWGGGFGNAIFILITGYFMVDREMYYKKIVLLMLTMFLYSWASIVIFYGGGFFPDRPLKEIIHLLIPVWFGENWFVSCYILFSLFMPFVNRLLVSLSKREYVMLLLTMFFVMEIMPVFKGNNFMTNVFWTTMKFFVLVYALGGFVKLHMPLPTRGTEGASKKWLRSMAVTIGLMCLVVLVKDGIGMLRGMEISLSFPANLAEIFGIVAAFFLFLSFLYRKPFRSRYVNSVAASMLGVYLIHENSLVRPFLWWYVFPNIDYLDVSWYPLFLLVKVLAVFMLCLAIDQFRLRFIQPVYEGFLDRHWEQMVRWGERRKDWIYRRFD